MLALRISALYIHLHVIKSHQSQLKRPFFLKHPEGQLVTTEISSMT